MFAVCSSIFSFQNRDLSAAALTKACGVALAFALVSAVSRAQQPLPAAPSASLSLATSQSGAQGAASGRNPSSPPASATPQNTQTSVAGTNSAANPSPAA